jgi:hypothetical protein
MNLKDDDTVSAIALVADAGPEEIAAGNGGAPSENGSG